MNRTITVNFFLGLFTGALLGAIAGLLFAPSSGEDLRQQINDRAQYVQDEVKRAAAERRTELEQQLADLRAPRPIGSGPSSGTIPT
jgi:gas vesicle protein